MVFCFSSASAALVMIGNQVGAKEEDTAKAYARRFSWLSVLMGMVIGAVVLFTAPAILSLFKVSEEARLAAVAMLRIFGIILPVRMLNVVLIVGVFRGGGDASFGLKVEAGTMWLTGYPWPSSVPCCSNGRWSWWCCSSAQRKSSNASFLWYD